mgnify:CR=1 FL=1
MSKEYLKKYFRMKPEVNEIFDDLDKYREFCVDYGRVFNEAELGDQRSQNWIDYQRFSRGKFVRNHWDGPPKKEWKPREGQSRGYNNYRSGGYNRHA